MSETNLTQKEIERKERERVLNELETRFNQFYKAKSVVGQLKAAFNDHKGMSRRELIPSVAKRIVGGVSGLVLQIISEMRSSGV